MRKLLAVMLGVVGLFSAAVPIAVVRAATFTVTTTADSGTGSLRDAITAANATVDADVIEFDLPGTGPHVIQPLTALPSVTGAVVIDGTSEPDFASCAAGPVVEIDGTSAGATHGLTLSSASTVRGLAINRFTTSGRAGVFINNSHARVECSFLGTDTTGTVDLGNNIGALVSASATLGGAGAAGNLISGNTVGIYVTASGVNASILGNRIGTDVAGTVDLGNSFEGIFVDGASGVRIGSSAASEGNLISGNDSFGIRLRGPWNIVHGNRIGVAANGFTALGNGSDGIFIPNVGTNDNNTIGGTGAGQGNVIAFNGGAGVFVQDRVNNRILGNSIDGNSSLGINLGGGPLTPNDPGDVDTGPNNYQNFPVLTSAESNGMSTSVVGTLDSNSSVSGIDYRLEFFSSPACDPLGHGEGRLFLGAHSVSTDSSGHADFALVVEGSAAGDVLTASATDPNGNTSELSACRTIAAAPSPPSDCDPGVTNAMIEVDPPLNVTQDVEESDIRLILFREQQGFELTADLQADILGPGCFTHTGMPGPILTGSVVDSYLIHADNESIGEVTLDGAWTFEDEILGVIVSEAKLDTSDAIVGWPYTAYPPASVDSNRGTTPIGGDVAGDWIEIDPNGRTLRLRMNFGHFLDQVRVITIGTPAPEISIGDATVTEGDEHPVLAMFTATLAAPSADTVKVTYGSADGTAITNVDFDATNGVFTFAPGETEKQLFVQVFGDTLDEPDETFTVTLSKAGNASIADGSGLGTILDDDEAPPPSDDCEPEPSSLVEIDPPAGVRHGQLTSNTALHIFGEQHGYALPVTLAVDLTEPGCYGTPGSPGHIPAGTIVDSYLIHGDNPSPGTDVELDGTWTFESDILGVIVTDDRLDFADDMTADPSSQALGWPYTLYPTDFGNRGMTALVGELLDWVELDPDGRTLRLRMTFDEALDQVRVITASTPAPALSIDDVTVTEHDSGTTDAVFTVSLSAASVYPVKVTYGTANGSAVAPGDYTAINSDPLPTITFAPGETSKTITVTVNGDTLDESDETFTVTPSKAGNASIADGSGLGTILDDDEAGRILINKHTDPDESGQSFHFDASFDGDGFDLADGETHDSGPLPPGGYSVSEVVPDGWDLIGVTCSSNFGGDPFAPAFIQIEDNEVVTCDFHNQADANIVVVKETLPDGSTQSFDFDATYAPLSFSLADGQSHDSGDLEPGEYDVAEDPIDDWDGEASCAGTLPPRSMQPTEIELHAGETVTCTFTNTQRGRILVDKVTIPSGASESFGFSLSGGPDDVSHSFSLTDAASPHDSGAQKPGEYSIEEEPALYWALESVTCSDDSEALTIHLDPGETVTCTFTNEPLPVDVTVTKSASTTTPLFGSAFSYTVVVRNDGPGLARSVTMTDALDADLALAGSLPAGCSLGSGGVVSCVVGSLPPGQSRTLLIPVRAVLGCTIAGGPGADTLNGTSGADTICGGGSGDTIDGRGGNDLIIGCGRSGSVSNQASATTTSDDINPSNNVSGLLVLAVSAGVDGGDTISGGEGDDEIHGCAGADNVNGNIGNDRLFGDDGDDDLYGDGGQDELFGGDGSDDLFGGADADFLAGGTGGDRVEGDAGDDTLFGNQGNDRLAGEAGNDRLFGSENDDVLLGGARQDDLNGGSGNDFLFGDAGNDLLFGADGNDDLFGNAGNDELHGGTGINRLFGGPGTDACSFGPPGETRNSCEGVP